MRVSATETTAPCRASQRVIDNLDIFAGYRTAPHIDIDETKARAVRKLVGDDLPLAFDANNSYTTGGAIRVGHPRRHVEPRRTQVHDLDLLVDAVRILDGMDHRRPEGIVAHQHVPESQHEGSGHW